ncbi:hypothetical protein [Planktothricoides sp. SR001]|uniref:hypothetical protein n=1 Tax=Planktothricoides sp. SR001 TaxID=1705388 RepID=UPI0012E19CA4|nr:hypothetical protein [Planktothricoides sp. SR001]
MAIRPYDFCTGEWPFAPTTFVRANGHSPLRLFTFPVPRHLLDLGRPQDRSGS